MFMSLGHTMTGAVTSLTVTAKEQVALRPALSITVKTMVCDPMLKLLPLAMSLVTLSTPQLSLVAGVSQLTVVTGPIAEALTVMEAGHVMVGDPVSSTVTMIVQVASLPASSVAVTVI